MERTISLKTVKASTAKPNGKPPPGDKTLGLDSLIRFYEIEDGDNTEKGEEAEILVMHDSSLKASKQNLGKRNFSFIDMFDHEGPAVINAMRDLTVGAFEHLEITSKLDLYIRIKYMERILRGPAIKKF